MINTTTLDRIRAANSLADVLARDYGREVKPHGPGRKRCLCVFHSEKNASLVLNEKTQTFKCFGCGESGDVFKLVSKLDCLDFPHAVKKLANRAGVPVENGGNGHKTAATIRTPATTAKPTEGKPAEDLSETWRKCVGAFGVKHAERLAEWRGYSPDFVRWLRDRELVGIYRDNLALPVHGDGGAVLGIHYRLQLDSKVTWAYWPNGCKARPLVIGDTKAAAYILALESQWDLLAVLDKRQWHVQQDRALAFVATRGAANGKVIGGLVGRGAVVLAYPQNDEPGAKWLQDVADNATGAKVLQVQTPSPHKDANDWTRAGATLKDLTRAEAHAATVQPSKDAPRPLIEFLKPSELRAYQPPEGVVLVGDCHITRGNVFVIGGAPGIGKSRSVVALAEAGAKCAGWFGLPVRCPFKTMIVQNENGQFRLSKEFSELDCAALDNFVRVCPPPPFGLTFERPEFQAALAEALDAFKPDVVVVDPWNAVARDERARDYLDTFKTIRALVPSGDNSPALGIVAHTRKPKSDERTTGRGLLNLLAGSYVLGSVPRSVFVLQSASDDPTDARVVLTCCKNNDGELGDRTAWERRNGLFAPVSDFDWMEFDRPASDRPTVTEADIAEVLEHGRRRVRKAVAIAELQERTSAGKSACYNALNVKGRFAKHLTESEGLLTWIP